MSVINEAHSSIMRPPRKGPQMNTAEQNKRRPYQFPGEDVSRFLIDWLNGPQKNETFEVWRKTLIQEHGGAFGGGLEADNKARERIVSLLGNLKELHRVAELLAVSKS